MALCRRRRHRPRFLRAAVTSFIGMADPQSIVADAFQNALLMPPLPQAGTASRRMVTASFSLSRIKSSRTIQLKMSPSPVDDQQTIRDGNASISEQQPAGDTNLIRGSGGTAGDEVLNTRIAGGSSFEPPKATAANTNGSNGINNEHDNKHHQSNDDDHDSGNVSSPILKKLRDKVGAIDENRIISAPEYQSGDVPTLFSNLDYSTVTRTNSHGNETEVITTVKAANPPSDLMGVVRSAALLCGTALGCGLLTLPTAVGSTTGGAGFLPTGVASLVAWAYMTISALLTSELLINRCGETGRVRNVGLLELYESYLGEYGGKFAGLGFLIVSYLVMGVYLSEGGDLLMRLLEMGGVAIGNTDGVDDAAMTTASSTVSSVGIASIFGNHSFASRALFATVMGTFLSAAARFNTVQRAVTHFFVPVTFAAFTAAVAIGLPTADFRALVAMDNQHPEVVLNAFPMLFMAYTYHGVVPRVVYDLEGDKGKITKAIVAGSTTAFVMYLTWNAVILGNVLGNVDAAVGLVMGDAGTAAPSLMGTIGKSSGVVLTDMLGPGYPDGSLPMTTQAAMLSSDTRYLKPMLQFSVSIVSEMAVITSLIGVVLGFVNEFNDATFNKLSSAPIKHGPWEDNKWKVALLTLLPPAVVSISLGYYSNEYNINNYSIIDYTGIFGSSVLFLILPASMAWQNRYADGESARPLTVRPLVPLGKVTLASLYKAAGTLIVEQGLEKLGVFEFIKQKLHL